MRLLALLIVIAGLFTVPQVAQARPAYGVAALNPPSPDGFKVLGRAGLQLCKLQIYWQRVEPSAGAPRDWSYYDRIFESAAAGGIRILPLLDGSPPWVDPVLQRPPLGSPGKEAAWASFVHDFAARYGQGGDFWRVHPSLPQLPAQSYEIWNEPNLNYFWGGRPSARAYVRLLRITAPAIRSADPAGLVVLGGLFENARSGLGIPASKFLQAVYRRHGAKRFFDAVALHPYAARPRGVLKNMREARAVMSRHRDRRTPTIITEVGWSVGGLGWAASPLRATLSQQASRLRQTFRLLSRTGGLGLREILWFSFQDGAEDLWIYRMGLFDLAGQPRPAWSALAGVAGGTP